MPGCTRRVGGAAMSFAARFGTGADGGLLAITRCLGAVWAGGPAGGAVPEGAGAGGGAGRGGAGRGRDGVVPVLHAPPDGNAAGATTHPDNLRRLRRVLHAPPGRRPPYVAGAKPDAPGDLLAAGAGDGRFPCGAVSGP